jgi:OOP family OmpA-OmpF porin
MLFQPRRWLPGVLPLALLAGGSLWWKQADIEKDLAARTERAIAASGSTVDGKPWAEVTVRGRDAVVTGDAPAAAAIGTAAGIAADQFGVRRATADADLIEPANPFGWSARRDGQIVTLSGHVAPDGSRTRLVEAARKAVPGAEVADLMTVARDVPQTATLAAEIGIAQLGRVAGGSASLAGSTFTFTGDAADAARRAEIATAIDHLPQGISRGVITIRVPVAPTAQAPAPAPEAIMPPAPAAPPVAAAQAAAPQAAAPVPPPQAAPPPPAVAAWSATKAADGSLSLAGTVGSEEARQRIIEAAMASTSGPVIDAMTVAAGLPDAVEAKVIAALKQLGDLSSGSVSIAGSVFSLTGTAASPAAQDRLAAAVRGASDGFTVGNLAIAPPVVTPFTWSARKNGGGVTLSGFAPSEAAKAAVLMLAGGIAGGRPVIDEMRIASGLPAGIDFPALTGVALAQLGKLGEGSVQLAGNRLTLAGRAPDFDTSAAIRQALAAIDAPVTAISDLTLPAADIPAPPTLPPLSADLIPPAAPPAPAANLSAASSAASPPPATTAQAPAATPPPVAAPAPRPDCSTIIQTALEGDRILFDYWKAEQRAEHGPVLDRLAASIRRCATDERIEVAGHADIHNRTQANQQLSEQRAGLMRAELVRRGVAADALVVVGYAETRPVVPNDTEANRALNRRVEFHVRPRN